MGGTLLKALAVAAACIIGSQANAATITHNYEVTSAVGSGNDHSLWISSGLGSGIGRDFDFSPAGMFSIFSNGMAKLTGRVVSQDNPAAGFDLSFMYDNTFLKDPKFKSENGSVATDDTFFLDLEGGTLIGTGLLAGLDLSVVRKPANGKYATQIGSGTDTQNGANNKNSNFGMSTWFTIQVDRADCIICNTSTIQNLNGRQGDINIDLNVAPVPLPAGGLLLLTAFAAAAGLHLRKSAA